MKFTITAACALLLAISNLSPASADVIDLIQDDSNPANGVTDATFSLTAARGQTVTDTQSGDESDIIGGSRRVTLTEPGNLFFATSTTAEKIEGTNFIDVQGISLSNATLTLDYDDVDGADFMTNFDSIAVEIGKVQNDPSSPTGNPSRGSLILSASIESSAGSGTAFAETESLTDGFLDTPGTYFINFSDAGFSNVDFTDVDQISITFQTRLQGTDFQINSISTAAAVPEPSSLGFLMAGSGLVLARRRRRTVS